MSIQEPPPITEPRGFAERYAPQQSGNDEMLEADGSLREHWRMLVSQFDDLGPEEILHRWDQGRRMIRENGITHNVYGDPNGIDRPWNLDVVPLVIPSAVWKCVGAGLSQRAQLLNALLADIHGPNRCMAEGLLPPELVYENPGFLRPCHGIRPPRGLWLHLYSADLVRDQTGTFHVLTDRSQAPSGTGYCLENRIVLSSILPTAFRQCNVHRLAPFFIELRQMLRSLAPSREYPRIVLLTPGPYNETYFEHVYLSRYLGYTLVQGNDLTVRDGIVFLKTLGGLQRVDVILRRVDDDFCDPLELFQHSFLGVPGLVEAVRQGSVAVANALGSGVVQASAFLPYLPGLCRALLGEELRLPSVRTWWCGDDSSRQYVLDNLASLVIKPAFPTSSADPEFTHELTRDQLSQLRQRIIDRPTQFVAQEHVASRTTPVLMDNHPEARRFVIRAYATADTTNYTAMAGALTRVTPHRDSLVVSLQRGGGSKDTWILAEGQVNEPTLLAPASQPVELSRSGGDLTSRVADDLFWLGRYVHRFEFDARVARCMFGRLLDQSRPDAAATASVVARALAGAADMQPLEDSLPALIRYTFGQAETGLGLLPSIVNVRRLVRGLRDRVSADAWRILQGVERQILEFDLKIDAEQIGRVVELFNKLIIDLLAFRGIVADSMTRGQVWRFLDMGARVESALAIARLVRTTLGESPGQSASNELPTLDAVLEIADSSLSYRRRYFTQVEMPAVVDLIVADETNPRAVAFQVVEIQGHLAQLPRESDHLQRNPDLLIIQRLRTHLGGVDLRSACRPRRNGTRPALVSLTSGIIRSMAVLSESISQHYFSHADVSRSLRAGLQERTT